MTTRMPARIGGDPPQQFKFVGREQALRELNAQVQTRLSTTLRPSRAASGSLVQSVIQVVGIGGVGKSALVGEYIRNHSRQFADYQFWIDGRSLDSITGLSRVLSNLLQALGVELESAPQSVDEKLALFRRLIQDRNGIIVIDDGPSNERLGVELTWLSRTSICIVTTRRQLSLVPVVTTLRLEPLSRTDSVQLLRQETGDFDELLDGAGLEEIAALVGDLPLSLKLAVSLLREAGGVAEVVRQLRTDRDASSQLGYLINRLISHISNPSARLAIRLAAALPIAQFSTQLLTYLSEHLYGYELSMLDQDWPTETADMLVRGKLDLLSLREPIREELRRGHLPLQESQLTRLVARWYMLMCTELASPTRSRGEQFGKPFGLDYSGSNLTWVRAHESNIRTLVYETQTIGDLKGTIALTKGIARILEQEQRWPEWFGVHEAALESAVHLHYTRIAAQLAHSLGRRRFEFRQFVETIESFKLLMTLRVTRRVQAEALLAVGNAHLGLDQLSEATDSFEHVLDLGRIRRDTKTVALACLARTSLLTGDLEKANSLAEKAVKLGRTTGGGAELGEALVVLGRAAAMSGIWAKAVEYFDEAVRQAERHSDLNVAIQALVNSASVLDDLGHNEVAKANLAKAVEVARGSGSFISLAETLIKYGQSAIKRGDIPDAMQTLDEASDLLVLNKHWQSPSLVVSLVESYICQSRVLAAKDLLRTLIDASEDHQNDVRRAPLLTTYSELLLRDDDGAAEAAEFSKKASVLFALHDWKIPHAKAMNLQGVALQRLDSCEEAAKLFEASAALAREARDESVELLALKGLWRIYHGNDSPDGTALHARISALENRMRS